MTLLIIAFFSWVLTVLAPCVLPLLPIILWASAEDGNNKRIPIVIIASLSISIIVFSLLLKASTILIDVPPSFWKTFSGWIVISLGIITLFPNTWKYISTKLWFTGTSNTLLHKTQEKQGISKYIFMGFALGPVFSSCSPTYALILTIILPVGFAFWFLALISYTLWLAVILFAIAIFGQSLVRRLTWASKPDGIFKKILWIVFICVGIAILTGYDKKIEIALLDAGFLNTTGFEQRIIEEFDIWNTEPTLSSEQKTSQNDKPLHSECRDGSCEKHIEWSLSFLDPEHLLEGKSESVLGYTAPDFRWLTGWINAEEISSLSELRWNIVMIKFWTASCVNCINTHKQTQALFEEFYSQGLRVIGIHSPEFAYEKKLQEVQKAVERYEIGFPVAQDNDFATWKAYNNKYWPAFYLIDHTGNIRYTHFWEWWYEEKRQEIIRLIKEKQEDTPLIDTGNPREEMSTLWEGEYHFSRQGLQTNTAKTLIDLQLVLDGWPWKDGIPAIRAPKFLNHREVAEKSAYLGDDDLGLVLVDEDNNARFYGYDVLVWHEIVNDDFAGKKVAVTFCPLCGSGIVYERVIDDQEVHFGVSGQLYNSNLLMYDSQTETLWSQSEWKALIGDNIGKQLKIIDTDLMSYSEYQRLFPEGEVLSNETGYLRRYGEIPYGNYDKSEDLYFPVWWERDMSYHPKKLFYVVRDGDIVLWFPWEELRSSWEWMIDHDWVKYTALFDAGLASVSSSQNSQEIPWYFEMWFSLVASHGENLIFP